MLSAVNKLFLASAVGVQLASAQSLNNGQTYVLKVNDQCVVRDMEDKMVLKPASPSLPFCNGFNGGSVFKVKKDPSSSSTKYQISDVNIGQNGIYQLNGNMFSATPDDDSNYPFEPLYDANANGYKLKYNEQYCLSSSDGFQFTSSLFETGEQCTVFSFTEINGPPVIDGHAYAMKFNDKCLTRGNNGDSLYLMPSSDVTGSCGGYGDGSWLRFKQNPSDSNRYQIIDIRSETEQNPFQLIGSQFVNPPQTASNEYPWVPIAKGDAFVLQYQGAPVDNVQQPFQCLRVQVETPATGPAYSLQLFRDMSVAGSANGLCGLSEGSLSNLPGFNLVFNLIDVTPMDDNEPTSPPSFPFDADIRSSSRLNKLTWRGSGAVSVCDSTDSIQRAIFDTKTVIYRFKDGKLNFLVDFTLGRSVLINQAVVKVWYSTKAAGQTEPVLSLFGTKNFLDDPQIHFLTPLNIEDDRVNAGDYRIYSEIENVPPSVGKVCFEFILFRADNSIRAKDCYSIAQPLQY